MDVPHEDMQRREAVYRKEVDANPDFLVSKFAAFRSAPRNPSRPSCPAHQYLESSDRGTVLSDAASSVATNGAMTTFYQPGYQWAPPVVVSFETQSH